MQQIHTSQIEKKLTGQMPGFFYSNEIHHWDTVRKLINKFSHWIYVTDNLPINDVGMQLEQSISVKKKGIIIPSGEFHLRETVVRAKPVVDAIEKSILMFGQGELAPTIVICEMTWAVRSPSGDIYLRELLTAFLQMVTNRNLTFICIYDERVMLDEQLMLGLNSHPKLYTENGLKDNPYYLPPGLLHNNKIKERFNYWMNNIDPSRENKKDLTTEELIKDKKRYTLERMMDIQITNSNEGRWKIRCFGNLRIYRENGELIEWNTKAGATKKLKTIFAFLLLRGTKGATGEELADLLWPESETTEIALNRLYHTIRYLRLILNPDQNTPKDQTFLTNQNSYYFLKLPADSWIDLPMFKELCVKGNMYLNNDETELAKTCYESAERLYTGDMFQDIPVKYVENTENDWCWSQRNWHKDMYHKLLYGLAHINRITGNIPDAIAYCDKALNENPLLEEAHKEKLLALAAVNRWDALHRHFRIYTESLKKFGNDQPSATIWQLYMQLSQQRIQK